MSYYFLVFKGANAQVDPAGNIAIPVVAGIGDTVVSAVVLSLDAGVSTPAVGANMKSVFGQFPVQHVAGGEMNLQLNGAPVPAGGTSFVTQAGPPLNLTGVSVLALMQTAGS